MYRFLNIKAGRTIELLPHPGTGHATDTPKRLRTSIRWRRTRACFQCMEGRKRRGDPEVDERRFRGAPRPKYSAVESRPDGRQWPANNVRSVEIGQRPCDRRRVTKFGSRALHR